MKKQLLFILLFLPAFLTAKEIRYFVQPGEILDSSARRVLAITVGKCQC